MFSTSSHNTMASHLVSFHGGENIRPYASTTEAHTPRACFGNRRSLHSKSAHNNEEMPLLAKTREKPTHQRTPSTDKINKIKNK